MIENCLHCGSYKHDVIYNFNQIPKIKRIGKKKNIVKCKKCSLVYCWPRNSQESMMNVYQENYWDKFQEKVGEKNIKFRTDEFESISKERLIYIKKFKSDGKFLDVGCSQGFLVNEAKINGFNAYGIDLNKKYLKIGIKKYNINLKKSLIKNYKNFNFDIITMFNVIEHVSFPDQMIQEIQKRIKKNGLLVIGTHDIECKNYKKEKENWKHIIPNEHLYFFSKKTLKNLVENYNFKLITYIKPINNSIVGYFKCTK